jgi:hypothetical protein
MAYTGSRTNAEFGAGVNHQVNLNRANLGSISLAQDSQKWDAMTGQAATTPHSVLSTYAFGRSANGTDGQNFLPNGDYLGNANGMSAGDFDKSLMLRMAGSGSNDNLP